MRQNQGTIEQVAGGDFFDRLPGKDEVVFERKRSSANDARVKRVLAVIPDGFECTFIDANLPTTLAQQDHMESLGWRAVSRTDIKAWKLEDAVPASLLCLIRRKELGVAQREQEFARAKANATNAMQFDADGLKTKATEVVQSPVTVTGPVKAGT